MNLNQSLVYQEQNDNKAIILTDATIFNEKDLTTVTSVVIDKMYEIAVVGGVNYVALGAASNTIGVRFVSNATQALGGTGTVYNVTPTIAETTVAKLDTTIKTSDGISVVRPQINLITQFGAMSAGKIFTITSALLGYTANTELVDGLYTFVYTLNKYTLTVTVLVYGQIKVLVYDKLRQIPSLYTCQDYANIAEADLCGAYLTGIENCAYTAKTEELLNQLVTLENIILNGSNITW